MRARRDLVKAVLNACGNEYPVRRDGDAKHTAAWEEKNNPMLKEQARLMLKRSGRKDAADMRAILQTQLKQLQDAAPMKQASQEGCDKVAAELN
jgi:hypothetical protein